jgi:cation transport ATPase
MAVESNATCDGFSGTAAPFVTQVSVNVDGVTVAVINHAADLGLETLPCDQWDYRIGRGVCAEIQGQTVLVGNARLLHEEGLEPAESSPEARLATATRNKPNALIGKKRQKLD